MSKRPDVTRAIVWLLEAGDRSNDADQRESVARDRYDTATARGAVHGAVDALRQSLRTAENTSEVANNVRAYAQRHLEATLDYAASHMIMAALDQVGLVLGPDEAITPKDRWGSFSRPEVPQEEH